MSSLSPDTGFKYFFKACRKGDSTTKAVTVGDSAVRVLADGSEIKTVWESSAVEIRTGEEKLERRTLPPKFR